MEPDQSQTQPKLEFIFDSSLNLEETHYQEGYRDGFNDGSQSGKQDGRVVGLENGFEVGEELGFYRGCVDVWNAALGIDPNCFSLRVRKNIKQMEELVHKYPIMDPESETVQDFKNELRLKFKMISASLGLKLEYDGYPKSSEQKGIDF